MKKETANRRLFPLETLSDLEVLRIARDSLVEDYARVAYRLRVDSDADPLLVQWDMEANRSTKAQIEELQALIKSLEAEDRKER